MLLLLFAFDLALGFYLAFGFDLTLAFDLTLTFARRLDDTFGVGFVFFFLGWYLVPVRRKPSLRLMDTSPCGCLSCMRPNISYQVFKRQFLLFVNAEFFGGLYHGFQVVQFGFVDPHCSGRQDIATAFAADLDELSAMFFYITGCAGHEQ